LFLKAKETQAMVMTIMEVEPRESSGSIEKSSDVIVYELAEMILGKLTESIDADECLPSLLWVNKLLIYSLHNINIKVLVYLKQCKAVYSSVCLIPMKTDL
jgi:hypothetical protein